MVLLNNGINRVRDLIESDIFKCQAGTGSTTPAYSDTGLETADSNTLLTPTITKSDAALQITHTIPSTVGDGVEYTEQETQLNSGGTSLNRVVHSGTTKGANDDWNYITNLFIARGD